jgi:hypothetical protein
MASLTSACRRASSKAASQEPATVPTAAPFSDHCPGTATFGIACGCRSSGAGAGGSAQPASTAHTATPSIVLRVRMAQCILRIR